MRLFPIHHAHTHNQMKQGPLCFIWCFSIHTDQREKDWSSTHQDKTRSSTDCLQHECITRLVILINCSAPSPFTCFQYPTQSKEVMIYGAALHSCLHCEIACSSAVIFKQSVYLSFSHTIYIRPLISPSAMTADCSCTGTAVCKRPQGKHALNGESAACSQVLWVSKGHSRPKVTSAELKLHNQSLF